MPLVQEEAWRQKIAELLNLKATVNETYLHPKEPELEEYIRSILHYCEGKKDAFAKHQGDTQTLNELFRAYL